MNSLWTGIRAATYATGFVIVWGWVANEMRRYDERLGGPLPSWVRIPGAALILVGATLAVSCIVVFVMRGRGTPAPFDAPRQFVPTGPYRYVRNPMYIGGLAVLAGTGLVLRSPAIVVFSAGWVFAAHLFVVMYEEPTLRARFGPAYEAYCARVHRWIPGKGQKVQGPRAKVQSSVASGAP